MITNLVLENIKCFEELNVELSNLNILTGINGTGKSTVIQSLVLILQSSSKESIELNGSLIEIGDFSDLLHSKASSDRVAISLTIDGKNYSWGYEKSENPEPLPVLNKTSSLALDDSTIQSFQYISAERLGPRNNISINLSNPTTNWLGKNGEYTVQVLAGLSQNPSKEVLSENDARIHDKCNNKLLLDNVIAWMGEVSPNVNITSTLVERAMIGYNEFNFSDRTKYKATNVGFGLSYALSVVTALIVSKPGDIVILENPEAHLHPMGQSKMGMLMAKAAQSGVQVFAETHSEHVVNGSRIVVRKGDLQPDEMKVIYFSRDEIKQKSKYDILMVNNFGQLSDWPDGFFDQQAKDMKTLIEGN